MGSETSAQGERLAEPLAPAIARTDGLGLNRSDLLCGGHGPRSSDTSGRAASLLTPNPIHITIEVGSIARLNASHRRCASSARFCAVAIRAGAGTLGRGRPGG